MKIGNDCGSLEVKIREVIGKDAGLEVCSEDKPGTFTGYASVFGKQDLQDEIMDKGAFKRTISHKDGRFPLLWQHNRDEPIGRVMVEEDDRGLKVSEGILRISTHRGSDAYELLKAGDVEGMSIGFRTIKDEWDRQTNVRHLKEVELWEVSLVTFPANPWAKVRAVKNLETLSSGAKEMLDKTDVDDARMIAAAASLCDGHDLPDMDEEDMSFSMRWIERCYRKRGRVAPWIADQSIGELARHVIDMKDHLTEETKVDLLRALGGQTNSSSVEKTDSYFDWLVQTEPGPDEKPLFRFLDEIASGH